MTSTEPGPAVRPLRLPAVVSSLGSLAEYAQQLAAEADLPDAEAYRLRLALDELFTNVATHGRADAEPAEVELAATVQDGRVALEIVDTYRPFDPVAYHQGRPPDCADGTERQPGGLGLVLVHLLTDRVEYRRVGGANHTTIVVQRTGGPG